MSLKPLNSSWRNHSTQAVVVSFITDFGRTANLAIHVYESAPVLTVFAKNYRLLLCIFKFFKHKNCRSDVEYRYDKS